MRRSDEPERTGGGDTLGIFDFLRRSSPPPAGAPMDKKVAGPAKVAADKRAQNYDRLEAIQTLSHMKSADAAAALLRRFSFSIDPSISDQEEKELAFQGIVAAGLQGELPKDEKERERAIEELEDRRQQIFEAVRSYCARAEQLTWPLKVLRELLPEERLTEELVLILERFDTEYARNVDPKVQVIVAIGEAGSGSEEARQAVERFLEDVNETVRFNAVQTTFALGDESSVPALVSMLESEESVRVKNKVGEGLSQRGWKVPSELREKAAAALRDTDQYTVDKSGNVVRG